MASQLSSRSDFTEHFAIQVALRSALRSNQYKKNAAVRKAAEKLRDELQGERSIYGRQLKMINLMQTGATLAEVGRKIRCSRRTVFRYLNHLEEAGISLTLRQNKYYVDKGVAKMLRA